MQISNFFLCSGDKDFHPLISMAQEHDIPVTVVVSDESSVSNDLLQLINYKVEILY